MNLDRFKQQFQNFTNAVRTFKTDTTQRNQINREVHHSISEYKRHTDSYRHEVNSMGIYDNNEFQTIFYYTLNYNLKVAFVIANREGELIITVGLIKGNNPTFKTQKVVMTYESFKTAINGFNREVKELGYGGWSKRHSLLKFENMFLSHFLTVSSADTRFKIEYAKPILEKAIDTEFQAFKKAKRSYITKDNKALKVGVEIRKKVEAYRKELEAEAKTDTLRKSANTARKKYEDAQVTLLDKLKIEYAKDKRFTFSFPFDSVQRAFKELF